MDEQIRIENSDDMDGLEPQSEREYLMIMFQAQKVMLKRQEQFNGFRREAESRLGRLEGSVGGVIGALAIASAVWAVKLLLGG